MVVPVGKTGTVSLENVQPQAVFLGGHYQIVKEHSPARTMTCGEETNITANP